MNNKSPYVLIAEDDEDDRMIIEESLLDGGHKFALEFVQDGQELIEFLNSKLNQSLPVHFPDIILLDLNMPKVDGRQALDFIKTSLDFRKIPTLILTTSSSREDIIKSYDLGANSYLVKPSDFSGMLQLADKIKNYWLETAELPSAK